jgi:O-antigen/teichoic acid export membrane protein
LRAVYLQFSFSSLKQQAAGSRTRRDIAREILPFALPAGIAGLTLTPAVWGTNALLAGRHGLHDLGVFSAAFTLKTLIAFVPMQLGTVFLPRYVAMRVENGAGARRQLVLAVLAVAGFSAALAVPFAMFGGLAMTAFGADFAQGADILRWLMVSVVFECAATLWSYRLAAERRMWTSVLGFTIPKDMILVAAAFVLVPDYGAEGLAIAHLVSWIYAILALAVMAVLHIRTDPDWRMA